MSRWTRRARTPASPTWTPTSRPRVRRPRPVDPALPLWGRPPARQGRSAPARRGTARPVRRRAVCPASRTRDREPVPGGWPCRLPASAAGREAYPVPEIGRRVSRARCPVRPARAAHGGRDVRNTAGEARRPRRSADRRTPRPRGTGVARSPGNRDRCPHRVDTATTGGCPRPRPGGRWAHGTPIRTRRFPRQATPVAVPPLASRPARRVHRSGSALATPGPVIRATDSRRRARRPSTGSGNPSRAMADRVMGSGRPVMFVMGSGRPARPVTLGHGRERADATCRNVRAGPARRTARRRRKVDQPGRPVRPDPVARRTAVRPAPRRRASAGTVRWPSRRVVPRSFPRPVTPRRCRLPRCVGRLRSSPVRRGPMCPGQVRSSPGRPARLTVRGVRLPHRRRASRRTLGIRRRRTAHPRTTPSSSGPGRLVHWPARRTGSAEPGAARARPARPARRPSARSRRRPPGAASTAKPMVVPAGLARPKPLGRSDPVPRHPVRLGWPAPRSARPAAVDRRSVDRRWRTRTGRDRHQPGAPGRPSAQVVLLARHPAVPVRSVPVPVRVRSALGPAFRCRPVWAPRRRWLVPPPGPWPPPKVWSARRRPPVPPRSSTGPVSRHHSAPVCLATRAPVYPAIHVPVRRSGLRRRARTTGPDRTRARPARAGRCARPGPSWAVSSASSDVCGSLRW